jgi:arabinoxylan arabinofuranohydrolase
MVFSKKTMVLAAAAALAIGAVITVASIRIKPDQEMIRTMSEEITMNSSEQGSVETNANGTNTLLASAVGKQLSNGNPLVAHKFGADPYALVFEDRVYLYMTNDVFEYDADGNVKDNTYGNINKITVISSSDLVNWTDHGVIVAAGAEGAAKWATQSWAPAIAHKVIDGRDKFFLYFANNASGIGVLTSDSPTGPWIDPISSPLILRSTPGVEDVTWLFDPAVLVDDDGKAYIYFGGGVPEGEYELPNTARVMQLGEDMVSVLGQATTIPAPYMFENAGINKYNNKYYYTYCSNFYDGERSEGSPPAGQIAYMTSDNPMGPWTYAGTILKNPGHFFGVGGNNHHAIFQFHDVWYIAYHAQTLSKALGVPKGYRSTHLNLVEFQEDGTIKEIVADYKGVEQIKAFNPYNRVEAATIGWSAGVEVEPLQAVGVGEHSDQPAAMIVTGIDNGDWLAVAGVDFGAGASFISVTAASEGEGGIIELRLDAPEGTLVGEVTVPPATGAERWTEARAEVSGATGVHHLFFVFKGTAGDNLFQLASWQLEALPNGHNARLNG